VRYSRLQTEIARLTKIVHICGIPGSGKTTYCEWLEREKGFLHLNFDRLFHGCGTQSKLALINILRQGPAARFVSELFKRGQSTAIDWGFPLTNLCIVRQLQDEGVDIWWFDGDRAAARQAFAHRDPLCLANFDSQLSSIEKEWAQIQEIIGDRVVETVTPGPVHTKPDRIFEQMFGQ
jgi:hypothetical protein